MDTKVALVTGRSSGIGKATALRLQQVGFIVYAAARRTEQMTALAKRECAQSLSTSPTRSRQPTQLTRPSLYTVESTY